MGKQVIIKGALFQEPILTKRSLTQYLVQGYYSWSNARTNTLYFVPSGDVYDVSGLAKRYVCATIDGISTMIPINLGSFDIYIPEGIDIRVCLTTSSQNPMTSGTFITRSQAVTDCGGTVIKSSDIPDMMSSYGSEGNNGDYRKKYNSSYPYVAWGINFFEHGAPNLVFTRDDLLKKGVYICK